MMLLLLSLVCSATPLSVEHQQSIELNDGTVRSVAFSPDGKMVAGCGDRFVQMFDVQTGERLHRLEGHSKTVVSIAYSSDGKLLASASDDGSIRLWNVGSAKMVRVVLNVTRPRSPYPPRQVAFSPDGKTLVACYPNTQIVLSNVESGKWLHSVRQYNRGAPLHLAFSPDGSVFAIAKDRGHITLMDVVEFGVRDRFIPPRIILPTGLDSTRYPLKHDDQRPVSHVDFSSDGKKLLSCGGDNTIRVWDLKTAKSLLVIKGPGQARLIQAAAFSPDGTRIISVTRNETIQVWNAGSGKLLATDRGTDENVRGLALSSDGSVLATCGSEGVIKLWHITNEIGDAN
jgi:WD40 repeat protein